MNWITNPESKYIRIANPNERDGEFLSLFAANNIIIGEGFKAKLGSNFSAELYISEQDKLNNQSLKLNSLLENQDFGDDQFIYNKNFYSPKIINEEIIVYPNPTSGKFTLEFISDPADIIKFQLFDINGNQLHEDNQFSTDSKQIDILKYPKGVYFIKITTQSRSYFKKIIKI